MTRYQCKILAFLLHLHRIYPSHAIEKFIIRITTNNHLIVYTSRLYTAEFAAHVKLPKIQTHSSRFSLLTKKDEVLITLSRNLQNLVKALITRIHGHDWQLCPYSQSQYFFNKQISWYYVLLAWVNNRSPSNILSVALFLSHEKKCYITKLQWQNWKSSKFYYPFPILWLETAHKLALFSFKNP